MRFIGTTVHDRIHLVLVALVATACLIVAVAWPRDGHGTDIDGPYVPLYIWADYQGGREDNIGDSCRILSVIPGVVSDTLAQLVVRGDHGEIVGVVPLQGTFEEGIAADSRLSCAVRTSVVLGQSTAYAFTINDVTIQTFERDDLPVDDPLVTGIDPARIGGSWG
jgi:hypothetical protein